jgi:hypothetical protein
MPRPRHLCLEPPQPNHKRMGRCLQRPLHHSPARNPVSTTAPARPGRAKRVQGQRTQPHQARRVCRLTHSPAANRTRDVEDAVPYGNVAVAGKIPHRKTYSTATTTPAASGHAPTASTTCVSNRSSTILPVGTPTAPRAHQPSDLSL